MAIDEYIKKFSPIPNKGKFSYFISFEGIDGSGKSTQIELFKEYLEKSNYKVYCFREPGATSLGENLREAILKSDQLIDPLSEALIFLASRIENLNQNILPLVKKDRTIILMDRFVDSSFAYQCHGRGLDFEQILNIHTMSPLHFVPDMTFYMDLDFKNSLKRRAKRNEESDYFEKQKNQFMQNVLEGYRSLSHLFPNRIKSIDANKGLLEISEQIKKIWDQYVDA